jgi:hypothetical protein
VSLTGRALLVALGMQRAFREEIAEMHFLLLNRPFECAVVTFALSAFSLAHRALHKCIL